jgi:hypothetical protein
MMVVTPNRTQTLVFSGDNLPSSDNTLNLVSNTAETNGAHVTLPGYTESIIVSPDSFTAYVAVPTAPVVGQSQGVIEVVSLTSGSFTGQVAIPSVHYLSLDNGGTRILAFSDVLASLGPSCQNQSPSFLFVVTPSDVGVQPCPVIPVPGFDHPVQAFFSSDDATAYVINCGAECGGAQASVQSLDLTTCSPFYNERSCNVMMAQTGIHLGTIDGTSAAGGWSGPRTETIDRSESTGGHARGSMEAKSGNPVRAQSDQQHSG